jgi:uncharacterized protein YoxC
MESINILYMVLLVCASALCIALIIYLNRITKSVSRLENEIKDIANQSKPLLLSISNLSEKINGIADDAKDQVDVVKSIISDVKEHADKILDLEEKVRRGIEDPVSDVVNNLSAVVNGINTFWKTYKGKHHT